jgi:hypothetical protein
VRFDEVVPSLKEVDSVRMYLDVLAAVHASGNEPSQGIADSEIKPFYVRSVDFATGFNAKGFHDFKWVLIIRCEYRNRRIEGPFSFHVFEKFAGRYDRSISFIMGYE